jgi:glycosyltransferase involved in cell wall biosynthesis
MILHYITRVNLPSSSAQSVQISAMCAEFANNLTNFKLLSTLNIDNINLDTGFDWKRIKLNTRFKYLEFSLKAFFHTIKEKPTHIYTRDIFVAFILSFLNLKVVYEAHKEPKGKIAFFLCFFLSKRSNFKIVSISQALSSYYADKFTIKQDLILTAHDGVFIDKYDKLRDIPQKILRKKLSLPLDKTIVLHTGSLYKGNDAKLFKSVISNFKEILFVQVGGSNDDIYRYKQYYREFANILFVTYQSNETVLEYQMSADLLFYALTKENDLWWCTSPLKIFEYMATNIPLIASNIGSVTEILNNKNSILFDPENESTIIQAVDYFFNEKEEIIKKASIALEDVRDKYTWNKRVENIINFLK